MSFSSNIKDRELAKFQEDNEGKTAVNTLARVVSDYRAQNAAAQILDQFGDNVVVKPKVLLKFGRSQQVDNNTRTTIMELPAGTFNETYVQDNLITTLSSSSTSDTQALVIEGHTIDGSGNLTFVEQSATLNGQTQVTLSTPLARVTRVYNNNSIDLAGDVYVYEDDTTTAGVPDTDSLVHIMVRGTQNRNQSFKASTSISSQDYFLITQLGVGIEEKQDRFVDISLESRIDNHVFREIVNLDVTTGGGEFSTNFDPGILIRKNSDVRLRALSDVAGTAVSGYMNGYLLTIRD